MHYCLWTESIIASIAALIGAARPSQAFTTEARPGGRLSAIMIMLCSCCAFVMLSERPPCDGLTAALQRGPVVYCLEGVDNGKDLAAIVLPEAAKLTMKFDKQLFGGTPTIGANAARRDPKAFGGDLYRTSDAKLGHAAIEAIPYFLWANRKEGEMLVWIPERQLGARRITC